MDTTSSPLQKLFNERNVFFIVKKLFNFELTPTQCELVRWIVWGEHKRISISACTRYGKSRAVTIAVALYILTHINKKVAFIGPTGAQADILRTYMAEIVISCPPLLQMADLVIKGAERLRKEASKTRLTFKNGCEYQVYSAEGTAERLMGAGANLIIKDESALISDTAHVKIMRMLGDDPKNSIFIELCNPWSRVGITFQHTLNPNWKFLHVPWQVAVKEGRLTEEFVKEVRNEMTPLEFQVLYDSEFPEEAENSLFNLGKIKLAENQQFGFDKKLNKIVNTLSEPQKLAESELLELEKEHKKYKLILACDPADKGLDESVIMWAIRYENKYQMIGYYSEPKTESMQLCGKISEIAANFFNGFTKSYIYIDQIGIGVGPLSRLKEIFYGNKLISVVGAHFGEKAIKKDYFMNKKAENYWRLRDLLNQEDIQLLPIAKLRTQMMAMTWELSSERKKIIDPKEKSPDWNDCLVYMIWKDTSEFSWNFLN